MSCSKTKNHRGGNFLVFEKFLKDRGVDELFKKRAYEEYKRGRYAIYEIYEFMFIKGDVLGYLTASSINSRRSFIDDAFKKDDTEEGDKFWTKLSFAWRHKMESYYLEDIKFGFGVDCSLLENKI